MNPRSDWPDEEINLVAKEEDYIVRRVRPEYLRHFLQTRKLLEDAGRLKPLPPDHWVWEALKNLPPKTNGNNS
jgi:hypothetical protein